MSQNKLYKANIELHLKNNVNTSELSKLEQDAVEALLSEIIKQFVESVESDVSPNRRMKP
jgi:hypothetical protein